MIEGIVGPPGAGKTLYGVIRMMRAHRLGRRVYANLFPRGGSPWSFGNWDTMRVAGEGLFVVDEAQMWFGSRTWDKNTGELGSWQQSRKRGADLIWIAQHENRVEIAIRELTTTIWRPKIIGPILFATGKTLEGELVGYEWALWRSYIGLYYTDQVVGLREDTFACLAGVSPMESLPASLRVARPTHQYTRDGRLIEYNHAIPAVCYLYCDYEGSWLELGPGPEFEVIRTISEPQTGWLRGVRAFLRDRNLINEETEPSC